MARPHCQKLTWRKKLKAERLSDVGEMSALPMYSECSMPYSVGV